MSPYWRGQNEERSSDRKTAEKRQTGAWELWKALPRARPYLAPYRRTLICTLLVLTVLVAIFGLAEPWPLAVILNQVLHNEKPTGIIETVFGPNPEVGVVLIVDGAACASSSSSLATRFTVLTHYLGAKMEQNMVLDLRSDLFVHVQRLSLTFHDERQTGALMSQINIQAAVCWEHRHGHSTDRGGDRDAGWNAGNRRTHRLAARLAVAD